MGKVFLREKRFLLGRGRRATAGPGGISFLYRSVKTRESDQGNVFLGGKKKGSGKRLALYPAKKES